jgi:hypothetical protein
MKKLIFVLVGVLVAVLILSFAKDMIIKTAAEGGVHAVTGLRLSIQKFSIGIIKTLVDVKGLRLFNPKGFKDRLMVDMPEIYINYDLPAAFKGKVHLYEMRINLKEFVVVKNENGELNLDSLKVVQEQKKEARPAEEKEAKMPEIQIDKLRLKIGKAIYKDYSKGGEPSVQEFDVNIDESYQDIDNPQELVSLIIVKTLAKTTIARLTNFDVGSLEGVASETLATAEKITAGAAAAVGTTLGETQEVTKETTEVLKETTKGLKDVFTSPFGGKKEK